jgi:hypothetical protein
MDPIVRLHQSINEPVPVVGRLYDETFSLRVIRGSLLQECGQGVGEPFPVDHLVLLIE